MAAATAKKLAPTSDAAPAAPVKTTRKAKADAPTWQRGEVDPLDLQKPYEPIAAPKKVEQERTGIIPLGNQLYQGDTIETLQTFADDSFHCTITDPPYNIAKKGKKGLSWAFSSHVTMDEKWDAFTNMDDYEQWCAAWLMEVCRVTKENGNIFIFGSYHNIYQLGAIAQRMDLRIVNSIIWTKPNAQPNITCRMFTESTEQILWLCNNTNKKAKKWTYNYHHMKELNGGKQMRNYWEIPLTPKREKAHGKHPSQKPLRVMERLVLAGTNPGDRVLDCFAGSGSTLLACDRLERRWVGIERDDEYCDLTHRRLDAERQQRRLFKTAP
ncbi:MAG: site-specific DNA-methyltransferase [Deltaproteobacteria bacterium]|nr:site-specific DNA-methyltransferase [Deltaproteobacteria bacterium]